MPGTDPSHGSHGTAAMVAAANGNLEVLRLLLDWGAALDSVDPETGVPSPGR
jgi:hypothetical protein